MWPDLMKRSKDAGLNAIETYAFWNFHERQHNVFDFSGRLDLLHFCELAQQHDLNVLLRIGPYICAEVNYGGLPAWLRDVPGMQMRTLNKPFMREMATASASRLRWRWSQAHTGWMCCAARWA
jgi:beta-galactosidase GanA